MTPLLVHIGVSEKAINYIVSQNTLVKIIYYLLSRLLSAQFFVDCWCLHKFFFKLYAKILSDRRDLENNLSLSKQSELAMLFVKNLS